MRKTTIVLSVLCLALPLFFVLPGAASAQVAQWRGSGGWGADSPYGRQYDARTTQTISGEVVGIVQRTLMRGMSQGVILLLKSGKEVTTVHLGPVWYLENQDYHISQGDKIEVTGSKVEFMGKPVILAAEVVKGDQVLRLREENGRPAWVATSRK